MIYKKIIAVVCILAIIMVNSGLVFANNKPSSWAEQEINEAIAQDIITEDTISNYITNISREETCQLLMTLYTKLNGNGGYNIKTNPFKDTDNNDIIKAYSLGIVNGKSNDKFAPAAFVTREEIATMIFRALSLINTNLSDDLEGSISAKDAKKVSKWAHNAIKFLNKNSIIKGDGEGNINPGLNVTNEQALLMILRAFKKFMKLDDSKLNVKLAIISDVHYFPADYVSNGIAFEEYLIKDRKLLAESKAIFAETVKNIKLSAADIVLVTGDLTKDGEKKSHEEVSEYLKEIESAGKKVYVIPGNHDINNPEAVKYVGDVAENVDNVTPNEFKEIYKEFGYNEAISKDENSLSYLVEPVEGMRILAIDSCQYNTNIEDNKAKISGRLSDETLTWVNGQIDNAKTENCVIFGMMHHNLLEHFTSQKDYFSDFVIDSWDELSTNLADRGLKYVFTGHFHASDITMKETNKGNKIYDIETNSLVSYPCRYRLVNINNNLINIQVKNIENIDFDTGGKAFSKYVEDVCTQNFKVMIPTFISDYLRLQGLSEQAAITYANSIVSTTLSEGYTLNDLLVECLKVHYFGDESLSQDKIEFIENMITSDDIIMKKLGALAKSMATDINSGDNKLNITIN